MPAKAFSRSMKRLAQLYVASQSPFLVRTCFGVGRFFFAGMTTTDVLDDQQLVVDLAQVRLKSGGEGAAREASG